MENNNDKEREDKMDQQNADNQESTQKKNSSQSANEGTENGTEKQAEDNLPVSENMGSTTETDENSLPSSTQTPAFAEDGGLNSSSDENIFEESLANAEPVGKAPEENDSGFSQENISHSIIPVSEQADEEPKAIEDDSPKDPLQEELPGISAIEEVVITEEKPQQELAENTDETVGNKQDERQKSHQQPLEEEQEEEVDWTKQSNEEILQRIKNASEAPEKRGLFNHAREGKQEIDRRRKAEEEEARKKFTEENSTEEGFTFQQDPFYDEFYATFRNYRKLRQEYTDSLSKQREVNQEKKKEIIDKMKALGDNIDQPNVFDELRQLQEDWKAIGPVPQAERDNINNAYRFTIKYFYDQRTLLNEMRDMDRRKNLKAREDLLTKIEALNEVEDGNEVVRLLRQYQNEWRQTGPVPRENIDEIKERYKNAVVTIYEKREKQSEELQKQRDQNYNAKIEILEKIKEIAEIHSEKVQDWIARNKEMGEWIEKWRSIGSVPMGKRDELKNQFNEAVRNFNRAKNNYFRDRKHEKVDNLKKKMELVERAEAILNEENPGQFRKEVITLQDEWKKVGPVPPKYSDKIWKQFITACDTFFKKLNSAQSEQNKEQYENLRLKNELIEKAEALAQQETIENAEETIKQLQEEFNQIGFVPFKEKDKIRKRFFAALNAVLAKAGIKSGGSGKDLEYKLNLQNWAQEGGGGGRDRDRGHGGGQAGGSRLQQEERKIQRDIKNIENEIATLENNMEFFRNSKTANALKENIEKQIEQLRVKMTELEEKLKMVREVEKSNRSGK